MTCAMCSPIAMHMLRCCAHNACAVMPVRSPACWRGGLRVDEDGEEGAAAPPFEAERAGRVRDRAARALLPRVGRVLRGRQQVTCARASLSPSLTWT